MAYVSTVEISVWKEHTCVGCGTAYRYLFRRTKSGRGGTPDASGEAAQRAAVRALENETDWHPCPGCGLYQPDMVAAVRARRHWWAFGLMPPLAAVLLGVVLADVVPVGTACWALAALAAACAGGHLLVDWSDPNRHPARNLALARGRLEAGTLLAPAGVPRETAEVRSFGRGLTIAHFGCYLLLAAAVLAALAPVGLRRALALPVSPGWHPEVVGPGETTYVYFDQKLNSVKSMWHGSPKVFVWNWQELGWETPPLFEASARQDNWGSSIQVGGRESKSGSPRLWARVTVPADDALVGQSVDLVIDMPTRWPEPLQEKEWKPKEDTFRHRATLHVARPGGGRLYTVAWWLGFLAAAAALAAAGARLAVLANRLRRRALPPRFLAPDY